MTDGFSAAERGVASATSAPDPVPRNRLVSWIEAMEARAARLDTAVRGPANLLVEQLHALAGRDLERWAATVAEDVVVRVWGWVPGGAWRWQGEAARSRIGGWILADGATAATMRIDVDRYFPGADVIGLDGDLSWVVSGAALPEDSSVDPSASYLVVRRVAIFATVRSGVLVEADIYAGIHERVSLDRLDRPVVW